MTQGMGTAALATRTSGAGSPVIGISCYVEPVDRAPWVGQRSVVLPHAYVTRVEQAGGIALVLPPQHDAGEGAVAAVLGRLDGVIIAGGADIEASRYGAQPHPSMREARPERDAWELALVRAATVRGLPLLGICRGMQVMAVAAGGRLVQHLPDVVGHEAHSPHHGSYSSHHVLPVAGSRLAQMLGVGPLDVPTHHHQAVDPGSLAGTPYVASAWHEDGTLEAIEAPSGCWSVGVQWHPEEGGDGLLFAHLVRAATPPVPAPGAGRG